MSLPLLASGYRTAAVALVDLGRIGEAKEQIVQLLKARPQDHIRPEFVRRHNRIEATAEAWIAALRMAGLPDSSGVPAPESGRARLDDVAPVGAREIP